jgi:hypothetical protein
MDRGYGGLGELVEMVMMTARTAPKSTLGDALPPSFISSFNSAHLGFLVVWWRYQIYA